MILATELGKDPLLRQEMRNRFRNEALISVQPTERGIAKIDEHHPYYASTAVSYIIMTFTNPVNRTLNISIKNGPLT